MPDPTPDDVRPQHEEALERAVYVRRRTAEIKAALRRGAIRMDHALLGTVAEDDADEIIDRRPVEEILLCGRRIGASGVRKILAVAGISGAKKVGSLTARQRAELVQLVARRAPWLVSIEEAA